jgi:predicted HAD superfamily Cof-like phosphohydrolase
MQSLMRDVARFHKACDVPVHNVPHIPPADRKALRIKLIKEEVNKELLPALEEDDLAGIADGMADSIYVIVGAALEYGIPLEVVWLAVQRANMAKVDPTTGKVLKRENGKILKPKSWTPPDIQAILGDAASGRYLAHLVEGPL